MKNFVRNVIVVLVLAGVAFLFVKYYSYIFARTVDGVIDSVEKISPSLALVGGGVSPATSRELFSFAVGIKTKDGEIVTGSSEDRQWMVAKPGLCAEARFFPYPPWQVDKAGTYFGARLLKLYDCGNKPAALNAPAVNEPSAGSKPSSSTPAMGPSAAPQVPATPQKSN